MASPIVIPDQSGLAQAITGIGSAFGQALQKKGVQQQQKNEGTIVENILNNLSDSPSPLEVTQALSSALKQGVSPDTVKNFGSLYGILRRNSPNNLPGEEQIGKMSDLFQKFGMEEEEARRNAELWGQMTVGGQTEMAKYLVDQIARNQYKSNSSTPNFSPSSFSSEENIPIKETETLDFPKIDIFEGRTPKEKVSLKTELLKQNNKHIEEVSKNREFNDKKIMRYDQLERLNNTKKLPENLGRLNVDIKTGELRVPALANEETQLYVKTINDFVKDAKKTFGARVTNFDVQVFKKMLPTLANTSAGRRLIISQMRIMTQLDQLKEDSLKEVYNHYGAQNIDRLNAEKIAEERRQRPEKALKEQFKDVLNAQKDYVLKQNAPSGLIPVIKPDGSRGYLPGDQVERAKIKGWKLL